MWMILAFYTSFLRHSQTCICRKLYPQLALVSARLVESAPFSMRSSLGAHILGGGKDSLDVQVHPLAAETTAAARHTGLQ